MSAHGIIATLCDPDQSPERNFLNKRIKQQGGSSCRCGLTTLDQDCHGQIIDRHRLCKRQDQAHHLNLAQVVLPILHVLRVQNERRCAKSRMCLGNPTAETLQQTLTLCDHTIRGPIAACHEYHVCPRGSCTNDEGVDLLSEVQPMPKHEAKAWHWEHSAGPKRARGPTTMMHCTQTRADRPVDPPENTRQST
eukprot:CAMPEP_0204169126 /NCGR_PEP_ID=MMETSP0361-20130328/41287_1 /ASSEMBLY_ACC=CAM_ASM_000343 /TAXON_ID=268821 /ORGANISM="Scrippsiella Hangoei, Strain SHTV-5" /LENGTH=192 /DNA_ID=CAMNT_0051126673 /DNA_START=37 /DNA_END=616 /DNA_ORIENTATION=+